jgi:hypothetical protein
MITALAVAISAGMAIAVPWMLAKAWSSKGDRLWAIAWSIMALCVVMELWTARRWHQAGLDWKAAYQLCESKAKAQPLSLFRSQVLPNELGDCPGGDYLPFDRLSLLFVSEPQQERASDRCDVASLQATLGAVHPYIPQSGRELGIQCEPRFRTLSEGNLNYHTERHPNTSVGVVSQFEFSGCVPSGSRYQGNFGGTGVKVFGIVRFL